MQLEEETTDLEQGPKNRLLSELTELETKENIKDDTRKVFFLYLSTKNISCACSVMSNSLQLHGL